MKKKMLKIVYFMLVIIFVLSTYMSVFALNIFSISNKQDGIEASISFDKQEYNINDKIEVSFNVKNNNSYVVKNIKTEIIVPSTLELIEGSYKQEEFSLNGGENKLQKIVLEKSEKKENIINDISMVSDSNEINNPQTGDNIVIYVVFMIISLSILIVIAVKEKWICRKNIMSLILCILVAGTMNIPTVVNAEVLTKEFMVESTIKCDGEIIAIKGKVMYTFENYNQVQVDGENKGIYKEGETVSITADEKEGYHFTGWTVVKGNVILNNNGNQTTTFVMGNEYVEIVANYEVNKYLIEVVSNGNGQVSPSSDIYVEYGKNQIFTMVANQNYFIEKVIVDGQDKGKIDTYVFNNVKDNHKIEVVFAELETTCDDINCANCDTNSHVCIECIEDYQLNSLGGCEFVNYTN